MTEEEELLSIIEWCLLKQEFKEGILFGYEINVFSGQHKNPIYSKATLTQSQQEIMQWRLILKEILGPNIQYIAGLDNVKTDDMLSCLPSANTADESSSPSKQKGMLQANNLFASTNMNDESFQEQLSKRSSTNGKPPFFHVQGLIFVPNIRWGEGTKATFLR